ncbi:hypothetical protein [Simkania negevensis]|uniref:Uncharacterized protein n=1 Tax=Simkania negevensis (strain ATCC VR-1471 / DSM 27360 / Z) TaxID=331113 RepID=F8L356_SIMNZ|nr:hypothetical protein [Simkania negevensis]CCB89694.1 hypothetical protein SNE_A18170 [Simkania negevensis Z]
MSSSLEIGAKLNEYISELQRFSIEDTPSKESFTKLAEEVNGFLQGLNTFATMANVENFLQAKSLLRSNNERFTEVTPAVASGIPNQTEYWPSKSVKELDSELQALEESSSSDGESSDIRTSALMLIEKITKTQESQPTFVAISDAPALESLRERVEVLTTPPSTPRSTPVHEKRTEILEDSLDIEEEEEEEEIKEEGPSFWKKVGVLALIGLVILAPVTAVLAPALMGSSSNSSSPDHSFDIPRGGTRTDFSPNSLSMPDFQLHNGTNNTQPTSTLPSLTFEQPTCPLNNTQPLDIHTLQPSFTPLTSTFEQTTNSTGTPSYTGSQDSIEPSQIRYVDVATLSGNELIPTKEGPITVIEYDSRMPSSSGIPMPSDQSMESAHLAIGSSAAPKTPEFNPANFMRSSTAFKPTFTKVHHTASPQLLALPKPPAKSVVIPQTVGQIESLNPVLRLPPYFGIPPLSSRDVSEVQYGNSTIATK